jgi:CheY-like chemotaxis protein
MCEILHLCGAPLCLENPEFGNGKHLEETKCLIRISALTNLPVRSLSDGRILLTSRWFAVDRETQVKAPATRKVLVVEDNELMTFTIRMMLTSLGYAVQHVQTARQALDKLDRDSAVMDLIFSDIVLPGELSGLAFANLIRERDPELPVMLTTGYTSAAEDARSQGFTVLVKPYPLEALANALDKIFPHPAA